MNEQELINSINQRLPDNQNRRIKAKDTRDVIGDFLTYSKETFSTKEELAEYGSSAIVGVYDGSKLPTDYALFDVNKVNRFIVKTEGIAPFTAPPEWGSLSVNADDIEKNEVFFIFETNDTWVKYVKRVKGDAGADGIDGDDGANGTAVASLWEPVPYIIDAQVLYDSDTYKAKVETLATDEPGVSDKWQNLTNNKPTKSVLSSYLDESKTLIRLSPVYGFEGYGQLQTDFSVIPISSDWVIKKHYNLSYEFFNAVIISSNTSLPSNVCVVGVVMADGTKIPLLSGCSPGSTTIMLPEEYEYILVQENFYPNQLYGTLAFYDIKNIENDSVNKDINALEKAVNLDKEKVVITDLSDSESLLLNSVEETPDHYSFNLTAKQSGLNKFYARSNLSGKLIHTDNSVTTLVSIESEGEEIVSVELVNKTPERGLGIPDFQSAIRLKLNGVLGTEVSLTDVLDSCTLSQPFSVKLKEPSTYNVGTGGVYSIAEEFSNYQLTTDNLGWVAEWNSTGLRLVKYSVDFSSSTDYTITTTELLSYSHPFNTDENLDSFIARVKTTLDGQGFEIKQLVHNKNLMCADVIQCQIQMCKYIRPIQINRPLYGGVPDLELLPGYVVDAIPSLFHTKYDKTINITLSNVETGQYNKRWKVYIEGTPVINHYTETAVLRLKNKVKLHKLEGQHSIEFSKTKAFEVCRMFNITYHYPFSAPENAATPQTSITTGRLNRIYKELIADGYKQISIQEFNKRLQSSELWSENAFVMTCDDMPAVTSWYNKDVFREMTMLGLKMTCGANTGNIENPDFPVNFGSTVSAQDAKSFQQFGEYFQHLHLHNNLALSTWRQVEYILQFTEDMVRKYGLNITRYLALPFDAAGGRYTHRLLMSYYGYDAVSASGIARGAVTQGLTRDISPRINMEDWVTEEYRHIYMNNIVPYGLI